MGSLGLAFERAASLTDSALGGRPRRGKSPTFGGRRPARNKALRKRSSTCALVLCSSSAFGVIHESVALGLGLGAALLLVDALGWRVVSVLFDRERLVTGTSGTRVRERG